MLMYVMLCMLYILRVAHGPAKCWSFSPAAKIEPQASISIVLGTSDVGDATLPELSESILDISFTLVMLFFPVAS